MTRLQLVAIAALTVIACGLAVVLLGTGGEGGLEADPARAATEQEPVTGKLSAPAYTVIALAADGEAVTDIAGPDGSFSLTPPAETSTLHLRAPDGTYAGPITLTESEAAIAERQSEVNQAKRRVKKAKKQLKKAKKQVKKAQKQVKKAKKSGSKQAQKKAKKRLKTAKKKLSRATKRVKKQTKKLRVLQQLLGEAQERQAGSLAIVGTKAGAKLGNVSVISAAGYAKAVASTVEQWGARADTNYEAQAKAGVPIGAGNFGRVRSSQLTGSGIGDLDRDGVSDLLDIDDDGNLVLDKFEAAGASTSGRVTRASASGDFPVSPEFQVGLFQVVNANMEGVTNEELENLLPSSGHLVIRFLPPELAPEGSPQADVESIELDCGQSQGDGDPDLAGLVYCTTGGTGYFANHDVDPEVIAPFPDCCDADGDGAGSLYPNSYASEPFKGGPSHVWLFHGASSDQIRTGDLLIQRVTQSDGTENALVSTIQYVFVTTSALISFDDRQGNSVTIDYPVAGSGPGTLADPFPVKAGPDGDVVLDLTFWRPQRKPIPPETAEWIDIGGLDYAAGGYDAGTGPFSCDQDAYSTTDPNLEPIPGQIPIGFGGGFRDKAADQPASPDNTFSFQLNLTQCLESKGLSFGTGEAFGVQFGAFTPPTGETVSDVDTDHAGMAVHFRREE